MQTVSLVSTINGITDGDRPMMGPILTRPFVIHAHTTGGPVFIDISEDAAVQLRDMLTEHLKARGIG